MLTPDQITAIAPDAASLKAGRDLGTSRKWHCIGGDESVLWGLAMGSGKDPYQTRVSLGDLASKCSCPSRKFPCKHAIGLMFLATTDPAALVDRVPPPWVTEWLDSRAVREEKAAARSEANASKPIDEKAAQKRSAQREDRILEGVALLQQSIYDLTREGLASSAARGAGTWENLAKRMVDCQAPGLAANLRQIADTVLRDPEVDTELALELGRIHLLLHSFQQAKEQDEDTKAELHALIGGKSPPESKMSDAIQDHWFVAGRRVEERDRLITSTTLMFGTQSKRWARLLRFTPAQQALTEPWPLGSTVHAALKYYPGLFPFRATADRESVPLSSGIPQIAESGFDPILDSFADALTRNPFVRSMPFLISLRPSGCVKFLTDKKGGKLSWAVKEDLAFLVECICGGRFIPMCGEWDGRAIRLLAIADGASWIPLTQQQA